MKKRFFGRNGHFVHPKLTEVKKIHLLEAKMVNFEKMLCPSISVKNDEFWSKIRFLSAGLVINGPKNFIVNRKFRSRLNKMSCFRSRKLISNWKTTVSIDFFVIYSCSARGCIWTVLMIWTVVSTEKVKWASCGTD